MSVRRTVSYYGTRKESAAFNERQSLNVLIAIMCNSTGVVKADSPTTPYHPISSEPVTEGRKISISVSDHERCKLTKFETVFKSKLRSPLPSKFLMKYSVLQFSGVQHIDYKSSIKIRKL
jgi:hypothetical protein